MSKVKEQRKICRCVCDCYKLFMYLCPCLTSRKYAPVEPITPKNNKTSGAPDDKGSSVKIDSVKPTIVVAKKNDIISE